MTTAPLTLRRERMESPLGPLAVLTDAQGRLRALDYEAYADRTGRLLARHYGPDVRTERASAGSAASAALARYFEGDLRALEAVEVATGGSAFQEEVWAALRRIPAGETLGYGALAARLGRAGASRAVGSANGANPVAIVTPCHRVVAAGGALGGYAGGLERKRWLLDHERRHAR